MKTTWLTNFIREKLRGQFQDIYVFGVIIDGCYVHHVICPKKCQWFPEIVNICLRVRSTVKLHAFQNTIYFMLIHFSIIETNTSQHCPIYLLCEIRKSVTYCIFSF